MSEPPLAIRLAASPEEREGHMRVRHRVFVSEQRLFDGTDRDLWDSSALHAVAVRGGEVVGAVRLYGLDEAGLWKGDRLAVLPGERSLRAASGLVRFAVATAAALGGSLMIAQVQVPNVPFFVRLGWEPMGRPFEYRGAQHRSMSIALGGPDAPAPPDLGWALGRALTPGEGR